VKKSQARIVCAAGMLLILSLEDAAEMASPAAGQPVRAPSTTGPRTISGLLLIEDVPILTNAVAYLYANPVPDTIGTH